MLYLRSRLVNGSPRKWLGRDPRRAKWRFRVIYGDFSATVCGYLAYMEILFVAVDAHLATVEGFFDWFSVYDDPSDSTFVSCTRIVCSCVFELEMPECHVWI